MSVQLQRDLTPTRLFVPDPEEIVLATKEPSPEEEQFMEFLDHHLMGQEEAKNAARITWRKMHSGIRAKNGVLDSWIAAGPSTTGKSKLPRLFAKYFHGDEDAVVVVYGSEYQVKEHLAGLIGSQRSLVGYAKPEDLGGRPHEKDPYAEFAPHNLRVWSRRGSNKPFSFVIVEEWEQACKAFDEVMQAILRDGKYTLGNGVVSTFYDCVFCMTTNIGMKEVEQAKHRMGLVPADQTITKDDVRLGVSKALNDKTSRAFRNRIGRIVHYQALTREQMFDVVTLEVEYLNQQILATCQARGFNVQVTDRAKNWILDKALANGGDLAQVKDVIATSITDPLGIEVGLKGTINASDVICADVNVEQDCLQMTRKRCFPRLAAAKTTVSSPSENGEMKLDPAAPDPKTTDLADTMSGMSVVFFDPPHSLASAQTTPLASFLEAISGQFIQQKGQELDDRWFGEYFLTITAKTDDRLMAQCIEVINELNRVLGIRAKQGEINLNGQPKTITLRIRALPGQIDMIRVRFPYIKIRFDAPACSG
jgi:hypothetical protein